MSIGLQLIFMFADFILVLVHRILKMEFLFRVLCYKAI
jgi:hypothetical protein